MTDLTLFEQAVAEIDAERQRTLRARRQQLIDEAARLSTSGYTPPPELPLWKEVAWNILCFLVGK